MSRRSVSALVRLPLWAIAIGPRAVLAVIGWAFLRLELPAVEYRTWPMARWPGRRRRRSGPNTSATQPIAVSVWEWRRAGPARPEASAARCYRWQGPRA